MRTVLAPNAGASKELVPEPGGKMLKRFRIFWLDGRKEVVVGEDIADACRKAGIQKGALAAMDYFKEFPFSKLQQRKNRRLERW